MRLIVFALLALGLSGTCQAAGEQIVRVGVLKFGTVNWELDVVKHHGLDTKHGVRVELVELSSRNATSVALQGGAVDLIVADWIWVSRQRADGRKYTFFPYSITVGGLIVEPGKGIKDVADLRGKKIGIAGGSVDKNWLLLRAYGRHEYGLDVAKIAEPVFAAPPLLNQLMLKGELDGIVTFWHYAARLTARGKVPLISTEDILRKLGVESEVPLLGWVFDEQWANDNRAAIDGFLSAAYEAKQVLATSDEEWQRLRPLTKAEDDATLRALREGFRAGVPRKFGPAEIASAERAFKFLAEEGGAELAGSSPTLSEGTFWQHHSIDLSF